MAGLTEFLLRPLHNPNLLLRQPVQLVHQPVDLAVGGGDLPLQARLLVLRPRGGQLAVQSEHLLYEGDHAAVAGFYHNNKRRARQDGKEIAHHALDQPCVYCGVPLDIDNLSLDHILPVSRGGNYFLTNIGGCCKRCNQIKGMMGEPEFAELLRLIQKWPARVANNLLSRLYAGGKKVRG